MARKTMAERGGAAMVDEFANHKVQLQVWNHFVGVAFDETAGLGKVGGEHAAALLAPLENTFEHRHHSAERHAKQILAPWLIT